MGIEEKEEEMGGEGRERRREEGGEGERSG